MSSIRVSWNASGVASTPLPDGDYNLSAYRSDPWTRSQIPWAPPALAAFVQAKFPNIPVEDLLAIRAYSAKQYGAMNAALRGRGDIHAVLVLIKCACSGLGALPAYEGTVYRAANLSKEMIDAYQVGASITELGFTSTSVNSYFADTFRGGTNVVYVIKSRATGHLVSTLSAKPEEMEVIFTPGTRFKVLGKELDPNRKRTMIYLEESP